MGWEGHRYWHNFQLELSTRQAGIATACVCLALLVLGRALLPVADRGRVRLALFFVATYLLMLLVKAGLLSGGMESAYATAHLVALVALAWGITAVAGLLIFDVIGHRFRVPKILRDLSVTIASAVAMVMLLSRSGVNLLSIITTSAVLTAVIGLALQDTLGNLLSGVALQLESSMGIGDWIRLEDRAIGRVQEIRWRSTVIRTKNDDSSSSPTACSPRASSPSSAKRGSRTVAGSTSTCTCAIRPTWCSAWCSRRWRARRTSPSARRPIASCGATTRAGPSMRCATGSSTMAPTTRPTPRCASDLVRAAPREHRDPVPRLQRLHDRAQRGARADQAGARAHEAHRAARRVGILAPLDDRARVAVSDGLHHVVYGAGEVIIKAGDPGDSLFVIREGEVSVKIAADGLEKEVATLGEGEFFGEMSLLTGEPRRATVVAKNDAECYVIDRGSFQRILRENSKLADEIGKLLSEREMKNKIEREGLSAEAARANTDHQALLTRIRSFFGLS